MPAIEQRLHDIEQRLARIEASLSLAPGVPKTTDNKTRQAIESQREASSEKTASQGVAISHLLGWSGAAALVLATIYLIQLALTHGWLTPHRQVGIAYAFGVILVIAGLVLRMKDREYASYLPAGGIVILFIATYGAHLYYPLISATSAIVSVIGICLLSLVLCRIFDNNIYAFFAVIGSYTMPLMFPQLRNNTLDLVIYFSAWSILFSIFSVIVGRRSVLLLALYLALIIFDLIWRLNRPEQWLEALIFQCAQLLIFGIGTAAFSIIRRSPMEEATARLYLPALLIFYTLQYALLNQHLPAMAAWIASGSALVLLALYLLTRQIMKQEIAGGRFLIVAYAALVLFHAGYLESVPDAWAGWIGLLALPLIGLLALSGKYRHASDWPVTVACALIFAINYAGIISDSTVTSTPGKNALYLLYPMEIYTGYFLSLHMEAIRRFRLPLIYAGHFSAMTAAVYLLDERLSVSLAWSLISIACLLISLRFRDRILGQSALFILAAAAAKVFLYDLANLAPLMRVFSLMLLGLTFYAGGWLYRKMDFPDSFTSSVNASESAGAGR
ncbi:MAG TPA: DUF2339 domain-containing protein [Mariprofundaceae bacterium]|nr:DUF2339 domain-containing protein [Mariprofundaceae bacterium]